LLNSYWSTITLYYFNLPAEVNNMSKTILRNLNSRAYEHPFDREALNTLEGTPGLEPLIKAFYKHGVEKLMRIQYTGSYLKITPRNYPEIYHLLEDVCHTLDLRQLPELYIQWDYGVNAFTTGVEKTLIVINSGVVDLMSPEEITFILGHEAGHIKSQHVLYHQMASVFPIIGDLIGSATLGLGSLVSKGVELALLNWERMSEFTADRAGLLACQDINIANQTMVKLAGVPRKYFDRINLDEFNAQAREFETFDYNTVDKMVKVFSIMWQDHPWTVMRGAELIKWVDSGAYDKILAGQYLLPPPPPPVSPSSYQPGYPPVPPADPAPGPHFCSHCGQALLPQSKFCSRCGAKV
jgi:Zn-dependent protease with chaperone function